MFEGAACHLCGPSHTGTLQSPTRLRLTHHRAEQIELVFTGWARLDYTDTYKLLGYLLPIQAGTLMQSRNIINSTTITLNMQGV